MIAEEPMRGGRQGMARLRGPADDRCWKPGPSRHRAAAETLNVLAESLNIVPHGRPGWLLAEQALKDPLHLGKGNVALQPPELAGEVDELADEHRLIAQVFGPTIGEDIVVAHRITGEDLPALIVRRLDDGEDASDLVAQFFRERRGAVCVARHVEC